MIPEPVKHLTCCRCGRSINPLLVRYLWVGWGERGAAKIGQKGNSVFRRIREQSEQILCGPCGDEWREVNVFFRLGQSTFHVLDSFERGVVQD